MQLYITVALLINNSPCRVEIWSLDLSHHSQACYHWTTAVCLFSTQFWKYLLFFDTFGWASGRASIQPVKIEWWDAGVVICLEQGAGDLHMVQLMPLPPVISYCIKIRHFTIFGSETNRVKLDGDVMIYCCYAVNMAGWGTGHWESTCWGTPVWLACWTALLPSAQVYQTSARFGAQRDVFGVCVFICITSDYNYVRIIKKQCVWWCWMGDRKGIQPINIAWIRCTCWYFVWVLA